MPTSRDRRPLKTRSAGWAGALARRVTRLGISPNAISLVGIGFAAAAAFLLWEQPTLLGFLLAAAAVQLRLLCNLLDGMVAVEGGRAAADGVLYNEFPDRIEDALILVSAGHSIGEERLGWACAVLAVMTAQARSFAGCLGQAQDFGGPMAKPQRMATVTVACLLSAAFFDWEHVDRILQLALWAILLGSIWTWAVRLRRMAAALKSRGEE